MSRSNNTDLKNPSVRHFEWNGEDGGFRYFDKSLGEKGERVPVPLPFRFLVLDCLSTIKGYDDHAKSGFWSNEIRNTKTDPLTVRTKGGIQFEGLYNDMNLTGAKYCQSVYVAYKIDGELTICNLSLVGAALSAWIDFRKKADVFKGAIEVREMIEGKKGKTVYQIPVFSMIEVTPETDEQAKQLDAELQKYLTAYFDRNKSEVLPPKDDRRSTAEAPVKSEPKSYTQEIESAPAPYNDDLPF